MEITINEERIIMTFDRDYGELIFRHNYKPEQGVIYLRLDKYQPHEPGLIIEEIIANREIHITRALTVVTRTEYGKENINRKDKISYPNII
jgi:predicted nuclease of predicted toxin-antitoxin system